MKQKLLLLLIFTLGMLHIKAQTPPYTYIPDAQNWDCGFSPAKMNQLSADTGFMNSMARYNSNINNPLLKAVPVPSGPYIVPVVFHLIDATTPTIPYAQIQWQMARLNAAFANQMNLFNGQANSPHGVNTQIEFRLACVAQNSLSAWTSSVEPGVMRYATTNTVVLNQGVAPSATTADMLAITHPTAFPTTFPFANYLNIWCVPNIGPGNVAGYGTFPVGNFGGIDGIVMRLEMIGNNSYPTNFSMFGQLDKGAVLAHEVGHYLGLYHTFESMPALSGVLGCYGTNPTDATTDGDLLLDTPPTLYAQDLGSILAVNSCTETNFPYSGSIDENDQLENYMCYSDDDKLNAFTQGQANRMVANFNTIGNLRFNLNDPANLSATGTGVDPNTCTNNSGLLTAIFNYSLEPGATCATSVIQFTNPQSLGFTATSWNWTFGDGTIGTGASPAHTYSTTSGTIFVATCSASDGTTTVAYSRTITISFDVFISGQSGLNMPVCKGTEQTIYITFGIGIPSAVLTDGTNQVVVNNYMNSTNPTFGPKIIPYTFIINNSATYNLVPASCGTVNLGSATFSVIECCNNSITNGDFSAGNTGFTTNLSFGPAPGLPSPTYFGTYIIDTPGSPTAWIPAIGTNLMNVTGNALNVDGFALNNSIVNITPTSFSPCISSTQTPVVWQQTLTGLEPSTTYYYSFKITENYFPFQSSNSCAQMNFATSITYSTSSFALSTQTLIPIPHVMGAPTNKFNYVVYTYTLNTPATTSTATPFSIQINQTNTFLGSFFDYFIDNITLNEMTSGVQAIGSNTICSSQTTTLSAIANCNNSLANYNYVWSPAAGLSSSTVMSPVAHPTATTIYTLIASPTTTVGGLSAVISTVTVTVIPSINIPVNSPSICIGQGYTLTATGASNYSWSPGGAITSTIVVTPTVTSIYTVSTTNTVVGCPSSVTATINVSPPTVISPTAVAICLGNNTTLTGSGANTYLWSTGQTTSSITVSPTVTSNYTVIGTNTITGCTNTRTVSVTVTPNPTVAVNNATICAGTSTVLTASGATTYSWNTGATTNTISVSPTTTTTNYTVTGTSNGCTNTRTVSVTVKATPTVTVNNATICPTASATLTASGATTYSWNTGATTNTISVSPTTTTIYTVVGTNSVGCTNTKTVSVTVTPTVTAVSSQSVICAGQSSTLTASSANTYSWSTGATTSSIVVTPSVTTIYTITGTSTNSCVSTKTLQVWVTGQYCCQTASFTVGASTATNTNYSNTSNGGGSVIDVLGTITFTANSTLTNYKIRMAPTASININVGVTVTFSNCTVFSCTDLWGGVFIKDGVGVPGTVNVINSRIEDMYMGIVHAGQNGSATGSADFINIANSVFNNNYISIQLRNYPRAHATAFKQGLSVTGSTITSQYSTTSPQNTLKSSSTYTYAYNNINSINNPYVNFPRGIAGIYLYNLEEIPVILGDSTGVAGTNRFENLDFGVYAENASIKAFNNHFINLTGSAKQNQSIGFPPPPPPAGPAEIGIGISAIITNGSLYWVRVGKVAGTTTPTSGNPFPAGNKFEDCGKGIAITNYEDPFVKGNVFTATTTSVPPMLTPSSLYSYYKAQSGVYIKEIKLNATITNNYILNHSSGVYTSHNIYASYVATPFVKVENNFVEAPGTNGYCRQAIQVDQVLSSTNLGTGLLTVKNNTIQNVYNGIKAFNVKGGLQINSNPTINLSASKMFGVPGLSPAQINGYARTGIYVQTCQNAVVANNPNITSNGTINSTYYTAVKGIWFNASTGTTGQVNCNVISNMGRCMQFSGTSLNKISKNVMNGTGDYQGFVLALNGVVGNQGTSAVITNDNEWNGFTGGAAQYAETYTETSNTANTGSIFYVKPGSPYQPTQNYSNNGNPYITSLSDGIQVQSSGIAGETCLALRMMGGDNSNTNNGNNAMRIASDGDSTNTAIFEALASDTTFYDVYQNETQYRNQQLVYELINTQSIDTTQTLGEFYEANQKTNYQTIISINEALANADYQTAKTINSSLTANNIIEEYQKRVNELLVKYINYQSQPVDSNATPFTNKTPVFDGTELADLSTIANSCFDKYGSVITQARVLMNNVSNTLIEFEDNCQPEFNQRKKQINNSVASNVNVKLYPNPNNGLMSLEYDLGNSQHANINLYDITGKLISSYKLDSNKGILQLNEQNLNNGIYFYHILVGEKTIKTDKIVIIK